MAFLYYDTTFRYSNVTFCPPPSLFKSDFRFSLSNPEFWTSSVSSPCLHLDSFTTAHLGITSTTGLMPRSQETIVRLLQQKFLSTKFFGALSSWQFSSLTLDLLPVTVCQLSVTRSNPIFSLLCKDHGRFGQLFMLSTSNSSLLSTVSSSSMEYRLLSICSFPLLDLSKFDEASTFSVNYNSIWAF